MIIMEFHMRNTVLQLVMLLVIFYPGRSELTVGPTPEWDVNEKGMFFLRFFFRVEGIGYEVCDVHMLNNKKIPH